MFYFILAFKEQTNNLFIYMYDQVKEHQVLILILICDSAADVTRLTGK